MDQLADDPFGPRAGRLGTVRGARPSTTTRPSSSRRSGPPDQRARPSVPSPAATRLTGHAAPGRTARPGPLPYLAGIEFHVLRRLRSARRRLSRRRARRRLRPVSGRRPGTSRVLDGSHAPRYPGSTLTAVLLNLRPGHPEFADPAVRTALLEAIDRDRHRLEATPWPAAAASRPDPAVLVAVRPAGGPAGRLRPDAAASRRSQQGRLDQGRRRLAPARGQGAADDRAGQPGRGVQPGRLRRRPHRWRTTGRRSASPSPTCRSPPGELVDRPAGQRASSRSRSRTSRSASTRTSTRCWRRARPVTGGSNVIGLQDPALDKLLVAARGPGPTTARAAAYSALQKQLAKGRYLLPLAFADESSWSATTLSGPVVRQVADPADRFWDVLTWRLAAGR